MNEPPLIDTALAPGRTPVIFGEVLFDCFPDGREVLGGAPFNVAWNLRGLGLSPYFISAVGDDALGQRVRQAMEQWGMEQGGLQTVDDYPTGRVEVTLSGSQPSYEIKRDQAYDHTGKPDLSSVQDRPGLLYHGSLVFRSPPARNSLRHLIENTRVPRFVDINIRRPHFDEAWTEELIGGASYVKINNDELEQLSGVQLDGESSVRAAVDQMVRRYGKATYLVTCGSAGAYAVEEEGLQFVPAPPPSEVRDTVGAGDSFAAAVITGLLQDIPLPTAMRAAAKLASRVCSLHGATTQDRSIYEHLFSSTDTAS